MKKSVRELTFDCLQEVYEIEKKAYEIPWEYGVMKRIFTSKGAHYKIIDENNHILGYAFVSIVVDEANLLNIAIDPAYQNKGLGRQLMKHIIHYLIGRKIAMFFLEVRKSNKAAYTLYNSLGFDQIGERKEYYPTLNNGREDAIIMACTLYSTL